MKIYNLEKSHLIGLSVVGTWQINVLVYLVSRYITSYEGPHTY